MTAAPLPPNEPERLVALAQYALLDTPAEPAFDDLVHVAAYICGTPISLITLISHDRQWYKARLGLDGTETAREDAFCAHAILRPTEVMVVSDALDDTRFAENPYVVGEPYIRFYAGAPLVTSAGYALGTLCVIDREPRIISPEQQSALQALSRLAVQQMEARLKRQQLVAALAAFERLEGEWRQLAALVEHSTDFIGLASLEGQILFLNPAGCTLLGLPDLAAAQTHHMADFVPAGLQAQFRTDVLPYVRDEQQVVFESFLHHFGGEADVPMHLAMFAVNAVGTETPMAIACIGRDRRENLHILAQLETQKALYANLTAVARAIAASHTLDDTLRNALDITLKLTHAETGRLLLLDALHRVTYSLVPHQTGPVTRRLSDTETLDKGLAGWVVQQRQSAMVADTLTDARWLSQPDGPFPARSVLIVPILTRQQVLGVLILMHAQPGHFTPEHQRFLEAAAGQLALSINNAQIYEMQRKTTERQMALYGVLDAVSGVFDATMIGQMAVEIISQMLNWPNVALVIPTPDKQHWVVLAASGALAANAQLQYPLAQGIIGRAFVQRQPQYIPDVTLDAAYIAGNTQGLRTALTIPIVRDTDTLGVLNIESEKVDAFGPEDLQLAESLAGALALALDNARLYQQLESARAQLNDLLYRFMPRAVADQLIAEPERVRLGGEEREVTVLFADLRGFTRWAEGKDPAQVLDFLNAQMAIGIEAVLAEGGTLDKFMGDALMAVFNAPLRQPDHALRAARAAWAMRAALAAKPGEIVFSIGLNTGRVVAGNVGAEQVMNYTVIGDAVNQAKRLQEMAQPGQILLSGETLAQAAGLNTRALGPYKLRGREQPVEVFELVSIER